MYHSFMPVRPAAGGGSAALGLGGGGSAALDLGGGASAALAVGGPGGALLSVALGGLLLANRLGDRVNGWLRESRLPLQRDIGGEAEELATRAYAPELLTLTLHGSGSAAFREGGQARYGFLSTLLRLPKELSLSGKRSLSNASCFQEARRKVTQLRHGVYAALLLAKANGRQLSGHRSRGRERPRA